MSSLFQGQPWMPQVMFCPEHPSPSVMLLNLLRSRTDLVPDTMVQRLAYDLAHLRYNREGRTR